MFVYLIHVPYEGATSHTPKVGTTLSFLAIPQHRNVVGPFTGVSNITPRPKGRPHKIENITPTTHMPMITITPPLLETPQYRNVAGSSIGLSNNTLRPRGPTTQTPTITMTPSLLETPQHAIVVGSSIGLSNRTPRPRGRPRKIPIATLSAKTGNDVDLIPSIFLSNTGGSDRNAEDALSKILQIGEAFSLARIVEVCYEDERPTITIAKPNNITVRKFCIKSSLLMDIQFSNLEELQLNQDENIYYYWENYFLILFVDEVDNTKPPLFADTFGNNGGDDSETSGPVTPVEEVGYSGHSSTISSLVEHESPRVLQLWERINIGDGVGGSPEEPRGNGYRTLNSHILRIILRASGRGKRVLVAAAEDGTAPFLEPQYSPFSILVLLLLLIEEYEIPKSRFFRQHLEDKVVSKEWGVLRLGLG
uniref:Uncharacterized protein n=1 Tax=Tanacetum cinerariifolium TaxID=118510 RepID=A0A6L2LF11_TANCI|nr:hypothetical protein [Tanacetum cinerariifolium]